MNVQEIKVYIISRITSYLLKILVTILLLILVFQIGVSVGFRKARFSSNLGDNYYRAFGKHTLSSIEYVGIPNPNDFTNSHGAVGKVLNVHLPTIIVSDANNVEKIILIDNNTIIRSGRVDAASTTITDRDYIITIGTPDPTGLIVAKLIRIIPPPPTSGTRVATSSMQ